ncbi:uncharacterized protein THITE_2121333 [Thermothielavioides terrestris NRRL 8126]|uniref:Uncharacterized protein n=1 Tax=Thermothielavioides terrestris (strain ATCC 38088 / NRRL 8126) TaxID=578455 RepID=G2RET3_THETT|nr:uncharacterized protein THITE_2121333 [Thermothielavioides terrestris NRRL 8126]AEO70216.1 hypothetical protein THITE_2121333 [Thermothielavioides terrestris NRRL 8126]
MLRDDALTPEFWPCVDQLAMQLMVLLLPLIRLMDKYFPASQAKPMRDIYQALHAIVAEAAYLSIGIRWSRNIFRFSLPYPGEPWDMDQEQVDNAVYNASEAARDKADKIDEELWKAKREPPRQPGAVAGSNIPIIGGRAGMMIAAVRNRLEAVMRRVIGQGHEEGVNDEEDAAHFRPSSRLAKVQIILWPMLQRFAAVGEIDPKTGAANGENVTTIFKSQVVYYCGWADESGGSQSEHYPTLADWVHESKRERMWKSLMRLRWIAYAAAVWLLLGFLSRYISVVDDILQIVRHGLVGLAKYVAREALLFVMEVLITVIAIAIGIAKIVMFLAYAVRNTLGHLLALAARLLWGAVGSIGGAAETAGVDRAAGWYDPAFSLPELSWQSMRGMAKAVAGEVVWKTVTVQVPAGYTRTG